MATTYLSSFHAIHAVAATATTSNSAGGVLSPRPRPSRLITCQASEQSSRRSACLSIGLGLATAAVLHTSPAHAADNTDEDPEPANNGWWLTEFPLPVPKIRNSNNTNSYHTTTQSFLSILPSFPWLT